MNEILPEPRISDEVQRQYAAGFRFRMDTLAQAVHSHDEALTKEAEQEVERHILSNPLLARIHERASRDRDYQL